MKNNARSAYKVLDKAGLTLMVDNWSQTAHFEISVEEMPDFSDAAPFYWADYYDIYDGTKALNDLMDKYGLFWEWINGCVIGVYDA